MTQRKEIFTKGLYQMSHCHPPGFANGRGASGQRHVGEMCGTLESCVTGDQRLAAPDLPVGAITGAVKGEANNPSVDQILRHARSNVRMVMLHAHKPRSVLSRSPFRRQVIRMKIVRDDFGLDFENPRKMCDGFAEEIKTLDVFEVADVLAQERHVSTRETNRIFQLAPDRKNRGKFLVQSHRRRNVASRPPYLP